VGYRVADAFFFFFFFLGWVLCFSIALNSSSAIYDEPSLSLFLDA
jgi:hypothetical protein